MRVYAQTDRPPKAMPTANGWDIVEVPSSSGKKMYRVDVTHGRCSCPAWIMQKGGERKICKHLRDLGFKQLIEASEVNFTEKTSTYVGEKIKVKL